MFVFGAMTARHLAPLDNNQLEHQKSDSLLYVRREREEAKDGIYIDGIKG